jgi:hypothetical protein
MKNKISKKIEIRNFHLKSIQEKVEKGLGFPIEELHKKYPEETLFFKALQIVTVTKKALCKALDLNIDNCCRYKRTFEKNGLLVESTDEVICYYSGHLARLLSTDKDKFDELLDTNQLKLF